MKLLKFTLVFAFLAFFTMVGCQKEVEWDLSGPSAGTLSANASLTCTPASVHGVYIQDTTLTDSNYVLLQINVTTPGTYIVKSDTIDGFSFKDSGSVATTGLHTVKLKGKGKPTSDGVKTFTAKYNTSLCTFDVEVLPAGTTAATYTLTNTSGACTSPIVGGTYVAGTAVGSSNSLTLSVNVTQLGYYSITSTVNGVTFSNAGTFTSLGAQTVVLPGFGTPTAAGTFTGTASGGGTISCTYSLTVGGGGGGTGTSVFTYNTSTGSNCSVVSTAGTYTQGTATTSANTITLSVNVTTAGTYSITSTNANGVTFTGNGTFATTGAQNVILTAIGTPTNAGAINYTVTQGSSSCTFSITCNAATTPTSTDYLITTTNTNWSDKLVGGTATDTTYNIFTSSTSTLGGNVYTKMYMFDNSSTTVPSDSGYYRRSAGKYYQYFGDVGLDNPINRPVLLLDSTLAVSATWIDDLGANSAGGIPLTIRISSTILEKNATATIASLTYTSSIIKVKQVLQMNIGTGFQDVAEIETWYARGKGIVRQTLTDLQGGTPAEVYETTRQQIF